MCPSDVNPNQRDVLIRTIHTFKDIAEKRKFNIPSSLKPELPEGTPMNLCVNYGKTRDLLPQNTWLRSLLMLAGFLKTQINTSPVKEFAWPCVINF